MAGDRPSSLRRVFCLGLDNDEVVLDAEALKHLRVLRLAPPARVELFDGEGMTAQAELVDNGRARIASRAKARALTPRVVLIQALPKGGKSDEIVRMATELGVAEIHFAITSHTVARPDDKRLKRWERIAREAVRQSERSYTPKLEKPSPFVEVLTRAPSSAQRLICAARATAGQPERSEEAWLAVGPEGGFTNDELDAAEASGFRPITLGPTVLRVDTAAVAAISVAFAASAH